MKPVAAPDSPTAFQIARDATIDRFDAAQSRGERDNGQEDEDDEEDVHGARLEQAWRDLSTLERGRINGLSADLQSLTSTGEDFDPSLHHLSAAQAAKHIVAGVLLGDQDAVLVALRSAAAPISAELRAFLRAGCWEELGCSDAAVRFEAIAKRRDEHRLREEFRALTQFIGPNGDLCLRVATALAIVNGET